MNEAFVVFRRELRSYFATPLAYVFIVIFLVLAGVFTFQVGGFLERNQADLQSFFRWHPWLYLVLIPAISMRLWAEERNSGSIELLMTFPITLWQAVVGKFLAAWCFAGIALALTFPVWITVNYLGSPDNGAIIAAYVGSFLMAGGFLSIGMCLSAATRNQVVAFITAALVGFVFLLAGFPLVLDFVRGIFPQTVVDAIASLSFFTHFDAISKGVIDLRDLVYFAALIGFWLAATALVLDMKKGGIGERKSLAESRLRGRRIDCAGAAVPGRGDAVEPGAAGRATGSHAEQALHLEQGHAVGAGRLEGARQSIFLFFARRGRETVALDHAVCGAGA